MSEKKNMFLDLPISNKPARFVIQEHITDELSHLDMRFAVNDHLISFTLDGSKITNDAEESSNNKILVYSKGRQHLDWLELNGKLSDVVEYNKIDSGLYEMGTQTSELFEVFLQGSLMKGRFIFRKKVPSNLEKDMPKSLVWHAWKPIQQRPFVLSRKSIADKFVPKKGTSAMSKEWEGKIPTALQWWSKNWTGSQALTAIKEARKILLKRNILTLEQLDFTLQKHPSSWILHMPSMILELDANPIDKNSPIKAMKRSPSIELHGQVIDKGKVNPIESTDNLISLKFSGNKLRGYWTLKKKDSDWILERHKEDIIPKKIANIQLTDVQKHQISTLSKLKFVEISDISRVVGCSKSTVMYHQRKEGFR